MWSCWRLFMMLISESRCRLSFWLDRVSRSTSTTLIATSSCYVTPHNGRLRLRCDLIFSLYKSLNNEKRRAQLPPFVLLDPVLLIDVLVYMLNDTSLPFLSLCAVTCKVLRPWALPARDPKR